MPPQLRSGQLQAERRVARLPGATEAVDVGRALRSNGTRSQRRGRRRCVISSRWHDDNAGVVSSSHLSGPQRSLRDRHTSTSKTVHTKTPRTIHIAAALTRLR